MHKGSHSMMPKNKQSQTPGRESAQRQDATNITRLLADAAVRHKKRQAARAPEARDIFCRCPEPKRNTKLLGLQAVPVSAVRTVRDVAVLVCAVLFPCAICCALTALTHGCLNSRRALAVEAAKIFTAIAVQNAAVCTAGFGRSDAPLQCLPLVLATTPPRLDAWMGIIISWCVKKHMFET